MAVKNTSLTFTTEDQSLWGPGAATILRVDSGDALIFDPEELTRDIDISLLGFGVEGEFYFDFKIGLFAYAEAPSAGSFSAEFNLDLLVDVTSGVEVGTRAPDAKIDYDIVAWEAVSASIESRGFTTGAKAGLDVILGLSAGIRDMSYFTWFNEDDLGDVSFFDLDERIPLVTLSSNQVLGSAKPSRKVKEKDEGGNDTGGLTLEPYPGISLVARLPSGANTKGASVDSLTVEASGASTTRFLELALDLDALIVEFGSKIPGVGAVFKTLGETIFAEHVFDINDYISFIPEGKIQFKATMLDIGAGVGAVLTEDVGLDISDGNGRPDLTIELVSDNGTPGDTSDDIPISTTLAQVEAAGGISFDAPTSGTGRVTLDATYGLQNVDFNHAMGIGLNASVVITALKASLGGAWVPSALAFFLWPASARGIPRGRSESRPVQLFRRYVRTGR